MKKALSLIYSIVIFLPLFSSLTIITAIVVMIGCFLGDSKFWGYYPPKYWSKISCRLALCRIKVVKKGSLDPDQSYVFIPNHQSYADIFLVYGYLGQNIKWVQKKELRRIPFVGRASEIAGHVFVDQSSYKSMRETIIEAEQRLSSGVSVTMFPEGARTTTGKMGKFKRGAFIIAKEMNLPLVPITINGAFDVMRRGSYLILPGKMELIIHEPIETQSLNEEDMSDLIKQCSDTVYSALWDKYKNAKEY